MSFNPELKDILEKDWVEIIRIILCSRLKLSNPKLKIEWDKIFITKYWVDSDDLDDWINKILVSDLKNILDNFDINPKPLVDAIKVLQDAIYTDSFLYFVFQNISEKQSLVFFNDFLKNHLEKINSNSKINIFNNEVTVFHALKIIKEAWKKIWKDDLFNDFKKASLKNISKIAREKWILWIEYKKYRNSSVQNLLSLARDYWIKDFDILSIKKINGDNLDVLNLFDLNLNSFLDKNFHSAFIRSNSISKKYLEDIILKYITKYKKDLKYTTLLSKYKTFYMPIIKKINKGIKNKIKNFESINEKTLELNSLEKDIESLILHKKNIEDDLSLIDETWTSKYSYKHKNKADNDILQKKLKIKELKESVKFSKNQINKEIITESELKQLKDFIVIKNRLESINVEANHSKRILNAA